MRRTRAATELATQRQSARGGPAPSSNLRTSSSDSDPPLHLRPRSERAPKLADGRSPRGGAQSHPSNPKKLGTRIADLESQLGLAQEELKSLKDQLVVSTDSSKKSSQQDQLDKKSKKQQKSTEIEEKTPTSNTAKDGVIPYETQETDVFEVPIEKLTMEPKAEEEEEDEFKPNPVDLSEPENPLFNELDLKNDEISSLKATLEEKDNEMEALRIENSSLKSELDEKSVKISSAQSEINELTLKLTNAYEEAEKSKSSHLEMNEKLEAAEKAKEELENEMKMLRVQTEQWRKAADAAASVLSGGVDQMNNGRRISERCGSMDKILYAHSYEHVGGYGSGYVGSPGISDDCDDVFGSEKRKGSSGMRMFGDLWKKKGQK